MLRGCKEQSTPQAARAEDVFAQINSRPWSVPSQENGGGWRRLGQPQAGSVDTGGCSRFHLESGCLNRGVLHSSEVLMSGEWMFTQGNSASALLLEHKTNVCPGKCRAPAQVLHWVCGFGVYTGGGTAWAHSQQSPPHSPAGSRRKNH